jgi:hypothetical protein
MSTISQERKYFLEDLTEKYGKAYARVIGTMGGLEYRGKDEKNRTSRRVLGARLDGFRQSAVIILTSDEYNEVQNEDQGEELVKRHRAGFAEAIAKDEADRAAWI